MGQALSSATRPSIPSLNQMKLSKYKLKSGNHVGWKPVVDENTHLTAIEKVTYLLRFLSDSRSNHQLSSEIVTENYFYVRY